MLHKRYCKSAQRGIFLLQEASAFSEWNKGLCSWLLESHDPCNWYFMANLRMYFRWLMVTFLSHQSETDCTFSYTQLWNFDFLYLKSYSGLASTKIPSAKLPFHQTEWKCIRHSDTLVCPTFCFTVLIQTSPQLEQNPKQHVLNCQSKRVGNDFISSFFFP